MQAPTVVTFTLPTLAQRRNERAARVAYFAWVLTEHARQFQGVPLELQEWRIIAACVSCGANTGERRKRTNPTAQNALTVLPNAYCPQGNWCDTCELQVNGGRVTPDSPRTQPTCECVHSGPSLLYLVGAANGGFSSVHALRD